jgi:hypothetical protein
MFVFWELAACGALAAWCQIKAKLSGMNDKHPTIYAKLLSMFPAHSIQHLIVCSARFMQHRGQVS